MNETFAIVAIVISGASFITMIVEKIFGGSRQYGLKLVETEQRFNAVEIKILNEHVHLRNEMLGKFEGLQNNLTVGSQTFINNIHELQKGLLEFRAKMAEDYMRRESYREANIETKRDFKDRTDELKKEMHAGFERLESLINERK